MTVRQTIRVRYDPRRFLFLLLHLFLVPSISVACYNKEISGDREDGERDTATAHFTPGHHQIKQRRCSDDANPSALRLRDGPALPTWCCSSAGLTSN